MGGLLVVGLFALVWPSATPFEPSGLSAPAGSEAARAREKSGQATGDGGGEAVAFRPHAAPPARRGATVHGTVRWDYGGAVAGAEVALLDEAGEVIAEARTDDSGGYALEDPTLSGVELHVTEPMGDAHERDLEPLSSGENRSVDVVLGDQREVVGWVLDTAGDPQPGVSVTLSWEAADSRWRAVTDAGGGFTFVDVPATPLRVTADGGDLGLASARLARSDATRREVTLVLEPVGTILVRPSTEIAALEGAEVLVRCFSASAHGEDGLWNDDLREPQMLGDGIDQMPDMQPEDVDLVPQEEVPNADIQPLPEEAQAPPPTMEELETMLGSALREWDSSDPEESLVRMATQLAGADARMANDLRREVSQAHPELANASLEDLARAAAQKAIRDEPRILDIMGVAAAKVHEGSSAIDAFMAAGRETEPAPAPPPQEADAQAPPAGPEAASVEVSAEGEVYDLENTEGEPVLDGEDPAQTEFQERIEELRELTGADTVEGVGEARSLVTTGRFLDPIPVRGAFEYQVSVKSADGFEIICGSVFVAAGEEGAITCGKAGPAVLTGRVVDTAGRPVEAAVVDVYAGDTYSATTDRGGRYELSVPVTSAQLLTVDAHDTSDLEWHAMKRNQNVRPGMHTEVPDIVARRADEMPVPNLTQPYGGIGANIELGNEGIIVTGLFDDGPLALAGAEIGDVIVRIGEEVGASLSTEDALLMLRGDAGSDVDLTLRSAAGELYELMVTRGLVNPVPTPQYE